MMTPRGKTKKVSTKLAITGDDSKILGRTTNLRREKTTNDKVGTLKMKTHNSAWTPVLHKASNEQIFKERRDLVSHWYDLWTDSQRKRFLDVIFHQSKRPQKKFVQDWFRERVPLQHLDFTTVLPRMLSVYIFSFLEPKSLSRAAQASWHWKFLTEQDDIWIQKCRKYGWFLPYMPGENEYGCWKRHYIACVQTMDYVSGSGLDELYGRRSDGSQFQRIPRVNKTRPGRLTFADSSRMMASRPPWQGPDYKPKDLIKSHHAILTERNPNDPDLPKSALVVHNKWGIVRDHHEKELSKSLDFEVGLETSRRRDRHRALATGADYDPRKVNNRTLSECVSMENMEETRLRELVETPGLPPGRTMARRSDMSGGGGTYLRPSYTTTLAPGGGVVSNTPRVVFISSRVPAADLLVDAVMFGVLPIVYEYEGTTTETLMAQLETVLQGRNAQSIGIFTHSEEPGEIRLVHSCTVDISNFDDPGSREFFESVTNHILPDNMGGRVDVFAPLAASEVGMELLMQLSVLTGITFSSPTGIIGSYNHVNSEWLIPYKDGLTSDKYFCPSKLCVWANVADQALEAIKDCRQVMAPYFEKTHRDIVAQLTGQVVFDALGQVDIQGLHSVTTAIAEGLKALGTEDNVQPLEFLGQFLLERAGISEITMTTRADNPYQGEETMARTAREKKRSERQPTDSSLDREVEQITSDHSNLEDKDEVDDQEDEEKFDGPEKMSKDEENILRQQEVGETLGQTQRKTVTLNPQDLRTKFGVMTTGTLRATRSQRLTAQQYADHPEKRTPIVFEILSSEIEYNRILRAVRDVYYKPLKSALDANRAIISSQNLHIIFTDVMSIFSISKQLVEDLKNRVSDWSYQHTCLGDIFVKFCMHLKAYTNFSNNNEVILNTIERCREQTPAFRAYLHQHQRIPETKMLTLQELLLQPSRRISEYVTLLSWFELHTPRNHADREDLANAITTLRELDRGIRECKRRVRRERELVTLQRRIVNCPALFEANRYLIKHLDVMRLKPPEDSAVPERRAYQHTEMLGLYLFNDALVVTRRTSKHFPFSRAVEHTYKFEVSLGLSRLTVSEIPDSKFQALIGMLKSLEGEDSVELMCGSHVDKLLAKLPPGLRSNFVEYCINREIIQDDKNTTYNLVQFSQWLNMKSRASRIAAQSVPSRSTESEARPISEPYRRNQRKPYRENAVYTCSTDFQRTNPNSDRFGKNVTYKGYCAFCNSDQHHLSSCEKFRELSTDDVVKWIKTKRRCWKCGRSHQASDCNLKKTCRICQKLHLTILHEAVQKATSNVYSLTHEPLYLDQPCQTQNVMLKVVPVILHGEDGSSIDTHAVLDDGSMRTMLLTPALNALDVKSELDSILLTTIRNEPFQCEGYSVNLSVSPSSDPATRHPLNQVFVSDQLDLSEYNYPVRRLQETYEHLRHIQLPDIQHVKPLIGSDNSHLILPQEPINFGPVDAPVAVRTKLGWTLQGSTDLTPNHRTERSFLTATQNPASQIMKDVERLWKVDVIPFARNQVVRSKNDNLALEILDSKTVEIKVNDETHYAAPLLRKPNDVVLQAGKESVLRNFKRTVRRLNSDPKGAEIYRKKIQELVDKGFVKKITEEEATSTPESWFIPHHMVEQHGKYRLVFNCSHEYQGIALNNHLLPGPTLGSTLLGVLLRFRQYAIAVSGDIQAMFHQVHLHPEDSSLLRFLWQDPSTEDAPEIYEWQVLPFGTTCSPCCAIYVLQRLSASHRETFPDVHKSVMESFYVDNCLESIENESKAQSLILEVREVLAAGGFNMRQWNSNVSNVVKDLPPEARSEQCELWLSQDNGDPHEATLGLKRNCSSDKLMYKCRPITYSKLTMKVVYRIMASQYDPFGFLAPFLARAKILVRDLWNKQRNWDEPIEPGNLFDRWQEWEAELGAMEQISLPRCYSGDLNPMHVTRQLHIFCDASEKIYGSVAYLRTESDTDLSVSFVAARSRVAPKKCLSIPRLELCAALNGAQLCDVLTQELAFPIESVHMWSDSTTVLCWLHSDSCRYKVFVGTHIAEIQRLSETHTWRFVPTKDNPADDITRGLPLKDLSMPCRWKLGPQFLSEPPQQWPRLDQPKSIEVVSELKQTVCHAITVSQVKFTDWESLLDSTVQSLDGAANMSDVCKFKEAEMKILRQAQRESFPAEVDALSTGKSIPSNSRLKQLSPEYDPEAQIIRVGGRLRQSSDLDLDTKHPIVLDPHHWITCLLIKRHDNLLHHYGPERLFAELRRKYWILRGREAVRKHQRGCLECNRWRANPDIPKMADFPKARLRLYKPPFYSCGVDCFGPMHVKIGRRREKRFGLIFKCLTTRAVHLDLLESMDTDAFLMALRRFIARRGQPHEILSDCGTNFKGGQRELTEAFESMNTDIAKKLARQQIHFRFNPPYAPHFGGTWEREIKSVKHGLRAVLGDESVPEPVLLTILIEVESILNSKPLGYVSSDIADPDPLTPNSLLLGRADTSTPQVVYPSTERLSKKRWRQCQVIADQFWKNFVRNYLPSLQLRNKWFKEGRDICEGDTVMIVEPQQIRSSWQIGQVVRAFKSPDGRVRSDEVRTSCGAQARLVKPPEIDND